MGGLATNISQAHEIATKLKPPFAIKAQVRVAGRGKAGSILFADSVPDAEEAAEKLLNTRIKGTPVKSARAEYMCWKA
jgi:succinyl-CoA synthetase beta subunit